MLCIAGFDPTGGAGLLADARALASEGVRVAAAITGLTRQRPIDEATIEQLMEPVKVGEVVSTLMQDLAPDAVKIGMLGSAATAHAVAQALAPFAGRTPIIVDPVLAAGAGGRLADDETAAALLAELAPLATLVTPNIPEAELLTGVRIDGPAKMEKAARRLCERGAKWALVKGGHLAGDPVDVLVGPATVRRWRRRRLATRTVHGTGCTLSSLIAGALAQGQPIPEAVARAARRLRRGIATAWPPLPEGWMFLGPMR